MSLLGALMISGCAGGTAMKNTPDDVKIAELSRAILSLGPNVDPSEASRAARIAVTYPRRLAIEYEITDPPIIHNMKVNAGLRPRGLCWHWAHDMASRLRQEDFQTLDLHHAIANADVTLRIEHSSVVISAAGDDMYDGLILDPWRYGGALYWGPPVQDTAYKWRPRQKVWDYKREKRAGLNPAPL
ncbi:hypothetical protein [Puniceibacterium sediminis]|uniref:hypothetical protein n=1 Tax=Puniceibacterium sediminis TaxID=1608407 RepID=UPI001FE837C2|nr:hypothetical protein [Puniceibacterium sediminis]